MIPYHRYVQYTDDGCGIQECLQCKARWEWRGGSGTIRFCMYCGVEFQGELECRHHDRPRWLHGLEKRVPREELWAIERRWSDLLWAACREKRIWVIEKRSFWRNNDGSEELLEDWHSCHRLNHVGTAQQAHYCLQKECLRDAGCGPDEPEEEDDFPPFHFTRSEFRLRRCDV